MTYPVNVGRNVARETANSHYIFPSDIELYPSPGLIPAILKMVTSGEEEALKRPNPKVFVSSIFEIKEGHELPETKAELIKLLKSKVVIPFHKMVCSQCHAIPKAQEWLTDPVSGMYIFFFTYFSIFANLLLFFQTRCVSSILGNGILRINTGSQFILGLIMIHYMMRDFRGKEDLTK